MTSNVLTRLNASDTSDERTSRSHVASPQEGADPAALAIFRIVFSLVGIGYLCSYLSISQILLAPYVAQRPLMELDCVFTIGMLCLLLIGWGGRTITVLHFLAAASFLTHTFPTVTVNEQLYLILSFWACFMRLDARLAMECNRSPKPIPAWPIYFLAIDIGLFLISSGLCKLADPNWFSGRAVGSLCMRSQLCLPSFAGLARFEGLTKILTYGIISLDLLWLPLFLMRKTRFAALVAQLLFFCGLMFPLRLDWIGEVGCCITLALTAVCPPVVARAQALLIAVAARCSPSWRAKVIPQPEADTHQNPAILEKILIAALSVLIGYGSLNAIGLSPWRLGEPNRIDSLRQQFLEPFLVGAPEWLSALNGHTVCCGAKEMFTASQVRHIGHMVAWRIMVTTKDNRELFPLEVFREDETAGDCMYAVGTIKYPLDFLLPIAPVVQRLRQNQAADAQALRQVDYILEWAAFKTGAPVSSVDLFAADTFRPTIDHLSTKPKWRLYCRWTPERGTRAYRLNQKLPD